MIDVFGMTLGFLQAFHPIKGNDAEISLVQVAVAQFYLGQRFVPNTLRGNGRGLGLDLSKQVVALTSSHALWKQGGATLDELVGLDEVAFVVKDLGPAIHGASGKVMVRPIGRETFQGGLVTSVFLFAKGLVVTKTETQKVKIHEGIGVVVLLVKLEEVLVEFDRLDGG